MRALVAANRSPQRWPRFGPILATAGTNAATDNLAAGALLEGLKVVRLGQSAKARCRCQLSGPASPGSCFQHASARCLRVRPRLAELDDGWTDAATVPVQAAGGSAVHMLNIGRCNELAGPQVRPELQHITLDALAERTRQGATAARQRAAAQAAADSANATLAAIEERRAADRKAAAQQRPVRPSSRCKSAFAQGL